MSYDPVSEVTLLLYKSALIIVAGLQQIVNTRMQKSLEAILESGYLISLLNFLNCIFFPQASLNSAVIEGRCI